MTKLHVPAYALALCAFQLVYLVVLGNAECYRGCDFRPCNWRTEFRFHGGTPDVALTGGICPKYGNKRIGHIFGTGEAFYVDYSKGIRFIPISRWNPVGLKPRLPRTFFKMYHEYRPVWKPVYETKYRYVNSNDKNDNDDDDDDEEKTHTTKRKVPYKTKRYVKRWSATGRSGVGHQNYNGNQLRYINRRCFVLPIRVYQQVNWKGEHIRNVWTSKGRDCVAFFVKNW